MTDTNEQPGAVAEEGDDDSLRDILRDALERGPSRAPNVLRGVQQKLFERSGGKFYDDQWSTAKYPPIATYLVTSAIMLAVTLAIWAVLWPLSGKPQKAPPEPAPVHVLPTIRR